jgi:hypothetical protein
VVRRGREDEPTGAGHRLAVGELILGEMDNEERRQKGK